MDFGNILSIIANTAYLGLSAYATTNPKVAWLGPVMTVLAAITKTPQAAVRGVQLTGSLKVFIVVACSSMFIAATLWR